MQVEVHLHAELAGLAPDNREALTLDGPEAPTSLIYWSSCRWERRIIVGLNGESTRLDQEHKHPRDRA